MTAVDDARVEAALRGWFGPNFHLCGPPEYERMSRALAAADAVRGDQQGAGITENDRAEARSALERMKERQPESVEEWADRIAGDFTIGGIADDQLTSGAPSGPGWSAEPEPVPVSAAGGDHPSRDPWQAIEALTAQAEEFRTHAHGWKELNDAAALRAVTFERQYRQACQDHAVAMQRIRELEETVERQSSWIRRGDADLERYEKDIVFLTDRAVAAEEFAKECRRQVFALCDDTEERCAAIAESDTEGKQGAFARGRIHEAKGIRRAFGEWFHAATEAKP